MTTVYRRYHAASHLTVLASIIANAVAELDPLIFLIGAVGVGVSYFMFRDRLVSPLPRWAANTMLLAALVLMFRAATGELAAVVSVVAQYLVYLQLIKLFESRTPRDQAQLLMLSLLVAISAVLTSVTLQVALVLLIYMPLAFWSVVLYQLYAGQLRVHAQRVAAGLTKADRPPSQHLDRAARRTVRRLIGITTVGVAATATVVFILMPRNVGAGAFGDWQPASYGATTGFNNEVRLGRPGTITESPTVVLEASIFQRLNDGRVNPYRANQAHRLRGAVLDEFDRDSSVWYRSTRAENAHQAVRTLGRDTFPADHQTEGANVELRVSIRNLNSSELFTLWKPQQIALAEGRRRLNMSPADGVVRLRNHRGPIDYSVLIAPDAPTRVEQRHRRTIFESPQANIFAAEDSRIRALAIEIIGDRVPEFDPQEPRSVLQTGVAERIVAYLTDHLSRNYAYTLDMMVLTDEQDPLEAFLFDNPAGHCEYFASALAALCRSVWIDARVVTGFLASEYNPTTQTYTIRQSHAHAWVEALVDRQLDIAPVRIETEPGEKVPLDSSPIYIETWRTFDPSPRLSLEAIHSPPTGLVARFGLWFDQLQFAWSSSVIGFDRDRQSELLRAESSGPLGLFERARDLADRAQSNRVSRSIREDLMRSLLSFATLAALAVVGLGVLVILRRVLVATIARFRTGSGPIDPQDRERRRQTRFFRQALDLLERKGHPRPGHLPASTHAASLRSTTPAAADAFATITALYYESRYGRRLLTEPEMIRAQRALRSLAGALPKRSR